MAGGEGSRLRPLTSNRPKPLVPIANRPIMEHILVLLKRHGVEDVVATLHYLANEIRSAFGDGSDYGMRIHYSVEDTPLGTAGSVKQAEGHLKDGTFIIVSGDALTDCDLTKAVAFHKKKKSLATLILYRVSSPLDFGVVITDDDGRIVRFLEKPGWSEVFSDTVNTGMYILEPEIFETMEAGKRYDWSQDIFPKLLAGGKPMYGYVMGEYWTDVGSLGQYREAQEHVLSGRVDLPIPGEELEAGVYVGPNCTIDEGALLVPPLCLGRNCRIKAGAKVGPYTVLGDNALIEAGAVIERSVLWDSAYIGPNVTFRSAIGCSRVTIKCDASVHEDAVIGDRCLVDVDATIRPRVKLWPDKMIERGSTVTMSLVWGNKWRGNLFRDLGVAGLSNIELTPDFATRLGSAYGSVLPTGSKVVASRDSTRSSRMLKRAVIAALLSVGCEVIDLRSMAAPIARFVTAHAGVGGAVHLRKLPGNARVSLIEMFDSKGLYLSPAMERKVETAFFREDFLRTDPDDLGAILGSTYAVEDYQKAFFEGLDAKGPRRRLRIVVDYGYTALSTIYPAMLAKLGVDSVSLNGYNDAKLAPRTPDEIERHVLNLRHFVSSVGYDMGALFTDEGERLTVVDDRGRALSGNTLLAALAVLLGSAEPDTKVGITVVAPNRLEAFLKGRGIAVIRTRSDTHSLTYTAVTEGLSVAGDDRGGCVFPRLHPGFDAAFALGNLLSLLARLDTHLGEVVNEIPEFAMAYQQVRCPWEAKGAMMRRLSEQNLDDPGVERLDGVKIHEGEAWALVLPDVVEPVFHVYAEAEDAAASAALATRVVQQIEALRGSV